jgi:hypothetical protein
VGFLDSLRGKKKRQEKKTRQKQPPAPARKYPTRSIISEKDLKTLADFKRCYPLPAGFAYRERKPGDFVVVRQSDGKEYVFLVEEGILAWDDPYTRQDGSTGYKTTEVLRQAGPGSAAVRGYVQRGFPLGANSIDDPDVKTFADLARCYPLPAGFEYRQTADGVPVIVRLVDGKSFNFLIEEGLLGFDEPYTKPDGKVAYKTTEVFKRA